MADTQAMPAVAQFTLPSPGGQKMQPTGTAAPQTSPTPPVAQFSLPGAKGTDATQAPTSGGAVSNFLSGAAKFGTGLLNSVEQPFVGLAAAPVQAATKALGLPDPYAQGIPGLGGTTVPVSPLTAESKLGDAAQVGSYLVPGVGEAGGGLLAGLGKTALQGAAAGALQGGGAALSQGQDLGGVTRATLAGGSLGGAVGGLTHGAGALIRGVGNQIDPAAIQRGIDEIKGAYGNALNLNASERAYEKRSGKDLAGILVHYGAPLSKYDNGTLDTSGAIEKLQAELDPLNEEADNVLNKPQGVVRPVHLGNVLENVKKNIQALPITATEKKSLTGQAAKFMNDEIEANGITVDPAVADKIKRGMWNTTFKRALTSSDQVDKESNYMLGKELQRATESSLAGTDTETDYHALNQKRSALTDAITRLSRIDGKNLVRGGRLGNIMGGLVGAAQGAAMHLPAGPLIGDYFGSKGAEFLNRPETRIAIAKGKAKAMGAIPKAFGGAAQPIAHGLINTGNALQQAAPFSGLVGGLLSR